MKGIEGMITFTYHDDIEKANKFYRDTMGFKQVMDRDWVKIFKVGADSHVGLVDSEKGFLKPQKEKPVMLSFMVDDIDAWYSKLTEQGVKTNHPPQVGDDIHMSGFLLWDPSGYVIEILQFLTKPYGE
ncbi:MAG: VOC family protein [Candidatus Bathyarchaeota archaeon]|nr:VOC family protein [Candidatus Bathyarchaeota archaeon]